MTLAIVDAGGANIGSLRGALSRLGVEASLTADPATIRAADKLILPGVGAAGAAMTRLREMNLINVLRAATQPLLGICLGMQLLCEHSQEDDTECLGLVPAPVKRLARKPGLRVPHMGWNRVTATAAHPLVADLGPDEYVYFVHGYAVPVHGCTLAVAEHGGPFSAVIGTDRHFGMQFHPERSGAAGANWLKRFLEL